MQYQPQNTAHILSRHVSGFHQYRLDGTPHPCYISENLCAMLGVAPEALYSETTDLYARHVHPADRDAFDAFLLDLSAAAQTRALQYRLVRPDGGILHVSDTMTSYASGGAMLGDSVLTDITGLKQETENLRFLSETMPCGFLKYTCGKTPKITYINDRMKQILGLSAMDPGTLELYTQNIYMLIPGEERQRFSRYLDRVYAQGGPIAGEMTVLRGEGRRACVFGWVTKCINEQGVEEFQSACIDITQQQQIKKEQETQRYLQALTEVYDRIFEYDLSCHTVKCLHGQGSSLFRWIENIPMQMEEATEKWILGTVHPEDREQVSAFFSDFYLRKFDGAATPPVIRYRALSSGGSQRTYTGLFVTADASRSLFCCRSVPEAEEADSLRSENAQLKNMQELVMRFTDGLAAFEVIDDVVTPLYASDNVCEFFGFTREEWLAVMKKRTPIRDFVSRSRTAYGDFMELLEKGEAEFSYFDLTQNRTRRIKAVCSQRSPGGSAPRYVMLYNLGDDAGEAQAHVQIRTFGYFDVFVDNTPIPFRNEKSKELFALLVDRRGGFVSSEEAISFLWEDEPANSVTLARYRKVALRLKNILAEYGIPDIVEAVNGKRRLVTEKVRCDLFDYLSGKEEYAQLFKGSYLSNYSWGETTLAELTGNHLYEPLND